MLWLTWRQHRRQARFAAVGLAVLAALMVPTGRQMHNEMGRTGLADCLRNRAASADERCADLAGQFGERFGDYGLLAMLFVFLPLLVGMFAGAPLVAGEVEHGTHRLVWTQGVSRSRWAAAKLGLVVAGVLVVAAGYALLVSWWLEPLGRATGNRFSAFIFDTQGAVPVGYTLFAASLGVFAGTVARKVLAAMAATLVGFVVLRVVVAWQLRPRFLPQVERRFPTVGESPDRASGDWITVPARVFNAGGEQLISGSVTCSQPGPAPGAPQGVREVCAAGNYNLEFYHPASRFWPFQLIETGLFVALAVLLLALAVHRIRRRIS